MAYLEDELREGHPPHPPHPPHPDNGAGRGAFCGGNGLDTKTPRINCEDGDDDDDDDEGNGDDDEDGDNDNSDDDEGDYDDDDDDNDDVDHGGQKHPEDNKDDEEEGDTTDGVPPQFETAMEEKVVKRPHIKSRRMQEYEAMELTSQGGRKWQCPVALCGKVFQSAPGLRYHTQQHERVNESFTCDTCQKVFKSQNGLKYHQKRRRCPAGGSSDQVHSGRNIIVASSSSQTQSRGPPALRLPGESEYPNQRLMQLANIATGPQSPLLQSPGSGGRGRGFFEGPETSEKFSSAVEALSSMAQRRDTSSQQQLSSHSAQEESRHKSKRPMNGFMLFAKKYRADFNRKFPNTNNRMISTKLSEEWKKLPIAQRDQWKEDARKIAEQTRKEHPDCWKRKKFTRDGP